MSRAALQTLRVRPLRAATAAPRKAPPLVVPYYLPARRMGIETACLVLGAVSFVVAIAALYFTR